MNEDLITIDQINLIKDKALQLGFSDIGFSSVQRLDDDALLFDQWIEEGKQAEMDYMNHNRDKRLDPRLLVEGSICVISLLTLYKPAEEPIHRDAPKIARYAYGKDYHDVLKVKLHCLFNFIKEEIYPALEGRVFVDSAPVLERSWAKRGGLGWIGKNTHLIHPRLGSYTFISELLVNFSVQPSIVNHLKNRCGSCTRCVDSCPTQALKPFSLDSRRCIAYLTIEHKGDIPNEFTGNFKDRVFGCDICQEVCPWNNKAPSTEINEFKASSDILNLSSADWSALSHDQYLQLFKGSAVKRAKYHGLMRNIQFLRIQ